MPKLRIRVPAMIQGGASCERELWLATYGENEAALLMSVTPHPELGLPQAPVVLCYGNAGTLSSCMKILTQEFSKGDMITTVLLGLPLIDMEIRRTFIGENSVVAYLLALRQFSQMNEKARIGLWEALLERATLHPTSDIILDPARVISQKIPA
jgi:hypothetical protein